MLDKVLKKILKSPPAPDKNTFLKQSIPHWFEAVPEKQKLFDELWTDYHGAHGDSCWDAVRVLHFMHMLETANALPAGDYAEFGTHKGIAAKLIWKLKDPQRKLCLFDTFEGFVEKDLVIERTIYPNDWHVGNFLPTSVEGVRQYLSDGKSTENLIITKGWFPETFAGFEDYKWRFVHIDFDLYQPIKECLEVIYPQLVPGGIVVIHDYGCYGFPGAKQAVDEFAAKMGLTPIRLADRWGSAVFTKPAMALELA